MMFDFSLVFCYFRPHFRMSNIPSDQKSQWVDLRATFTCGVIGGQNFLSPVRMVVQTCRFVFWNRNVKLHLTPRSKGQRSNLKKYAYFGRKQGNKKRSWSCDRYMIYVIDLDELWRLSHFPLKSHARFRSYGGAKGLFKTFSTITQSDMDSYI